MLQGPPGTGKTTSILAMARQLLGASFKEAVLELNASDDRCGSSASSKFHKCTDASCVLSACLTATTDPATALASGQALPVCQEQWLV